MCELGAVIRNRRGAVIESLRAYTTGPVELNDLHLEANEFMVVTPKMKIS